jgi:hypothetical protein
MHDTTPDSADGLPDGYVPIPESWVDRGSDERIGRYDARFYAVAVNATPTSDLLAVRYAHPDDEVALAREFVAAHTDHGIVPRAVVEDGPVAFPRSVRVEHVQQEAPFPATERELELLHDRHDLSHRYGP